jgi:hypothetical protein
MLCSSCSWGLALPLSLAPLPPLAPYIAFARQQQQSATTCCLTFRHVTVSGSTMPYDPGALHSTTLPHSAHDRHHKLLAHQFAILMNHADRQAFMFADRLTPGRST